jgi:molecular chaperone GrpE
MSDEIIELTDQEQLQALADENLAGWQRAKADYANLEKSWQERQKQFFDMAKAATVVELLPIINHFSLAVDHIPLDQREAAWVAGIIHIQRELQQLVEKLGVQLMPEPKMFDPALHEAVSREPSDEPVGTVLKTTRQGYTIGDKVIQPAQVVVSSGPPGEEKIENSE